MIQDDTDLQLGRMVLPVPLLDLGHNRCKFPVNDGDKTVIGRFLFCNTATQSGASYCAKHIGIVWPQRRG